MKKLQIHHSHFAFIQYKKCNLFRAIINEWDDDAVFMKKKERNYYVEIINLSYLIFRMMIQNPHFSLHHTHTVTCTHKINQKLINLPIKFGIKRKTFSVWINSDIFVSLLFVMIFLLAMKNVFRSLFVDFPIEKILFFLEWHKIRTESVSTCYYWRQLNDIYV